jgi:hypothetical protein
MPPSPNNNHCPLLVRPLDVAVLVVPPLVVSVGAAVDVLGRVVPLAAAPLVVTRAAPLVVPDVALGFLALVFPVRVAVVTLVLDGIASLCCAMNCDSSGSGSCSVKMIVGT